MEKLKAKFSENSCRFFFFFLIFCYLDRVFYIFIENNFQNNARIGGYDITFFIFDMENRVSDI